MAVAVDTRLGEFARFCSELKLENGRSMVLEPFQQRMLGDYFDGATESLILLCKKNGKTSLIAALALYHLLEVEDAECVIGAASRDQASILYTQAVGFVRRSESIKDHFAVKTGFREVRSVHDNGRIRVLAADASTADGVLPSLALVDELHRHRTSDLYGVFRDGLSPRDGQLITISTAGDDEDSPLGKMRANAYKLPVSDRDGAYRYFRSENGQFALHEWALDADQDRGDLELVKTANPASWQTVGRLRERHDSPSTTQWQWARFACGVWVRGEDTAIDPAEWDGLPFGEIPPGSEIFVGWDMAWRGPDTTAIVPLWQKSPESRVVGAPVVLEAPEDGMVDDRDVVRAFLDLSKRFKIKAVVYDPNAGAQALAQQIERDHGLLLVEHLQTDTPMALASARFMEAIRRKELAHDGDLTLRAHVLNAVEKVVQGERFRLTRPRFGGRRPIDCLTALIMAHSVAVAEKPKPARSREWVMFG